MTDKLFQRVWLAYLFCSMDFNLFGINLLPDFIGYILLLVVIDDMSQRKVPVQRLRIFVYLLLAASILELVCTLLSNGRMDFNSWIPPAVISNMMSIYLWYVLLTQLGNYCISQGLSWQGLYRMRNCNILLQMLVFFMLQYLVQITILAWGVVIAQIALIIWLMKLWFGYVDEAEAKQKAESLI